jgi:hypothetical protein
MPKKAKPISEEIDEEWTQADEAELKQVDDEICEFADEIRKKRDKKHLQKLADELNMPLAKYKQDFAKAEEKEHKAVFDEIFERTQNEPQFKTDEDRKAFAKSYAQAVSKIRAFNRLRIRAYVKTRRLELEKRKRELLLEKRLDQLSE